MWSEWDRSDQLEFLGHVDAIASLLASEFGRGPAGREVVARRLALAFELLTLRELDEELDAAAVCVDSLTGFDTCQFEILRSWVTDVFRVRAAQHNEELYTDDRGYVDMEEHHAWTLLALSPLSRRLRLLQAATKTTAVSLGQATGASAAQIGHWAAGRSQPSEAHREKLARAFGVHPGWFAAERDDLPDSALYLTAHCSCGAPPAFVSGPLTGREPYYVEELDEVFPVLWCDTCRQPHLQEPSGLLIALPPMEDSEDRTLPPAQWKPSRPRQQRRSDPLPLPHARARDGAGGSSRVTPTSPSLVLTQPPSAPQKPSRPVRANRAPVSPRPDSDLRTRPVERLSGPQIMATFVHQEMAQGEYRGGELVATAHSPAVWTLAHRGYSGSGRLDIWVHESAEAAAFAGAKLAMACGLDEDREARALFEAGCYPQVLQRYEETSPDNHLLRVQSAFFQDPEVH